MSMRLVLSVCSIAVGFSGAAQAADPFFSKGFLRGSAPAETYHNPYIAESPVYHRWEGFYVGGHVGKSDVSADLSTGVESLVAEILRNDVVYNSVRNWTTFGKKTGTDINYGGFVGYNMQFDDAIVGIEATYNRLSVSVSDTSSMTRIFQDDTAAPPTSNFFYTATVSGTVAATLTDYATARVRFGWAYENFMPYGFIGAALGRFDVSRTANVAYTRVDIPDPAIPPAPPNVPVPTFSTGLMTKSETKRGAIAAGFTGGLGVDWAILPHLFLRGEWEYVGFQSSKDIVIDFHTFRGGVGLKF